MPVKGEKVWNIRILVEELGLKHCMLETKQSCNKSNIGWKTSIVGKALALHAANPLWIPLSHIHCAPLGVIPEWKDRSQP